MNKQRVIDLLTRTKPELQDRFGVVRLSLFGSLARDDATVQSDIDILVDFEGRADSSRYFGLQFFLEDLLGCSVDLVTNKALRPEFRPFIERELVDV